MRTSARTGLRLGLAALVACAAAVLSGCGDDGRTIDWDLTTSRSSSVVDWKGTEGSFVIDDVRRVRILLPNGLVIEERDVSTVLVKRNPERDEVIGIGVDFERLTAEAADRRAKAIAEHYKLDHRDLDGFLEDVRQRRAAGKPEKDTDFGRLLSGGYARNDVINGSPETPSVSVEIVFRNYDAKRPWNVEFSVGLAG